LAQRLGLVAAGLPNFKVSGAVNRSVVAGSYVPITVADKNADWTFAVGPLKCKNGPSETMVNFIG